MISGKWANFIVISLMFVAGVSFIVVSKLVDTIRDKSALVAVGFILVASSSCMFFQWKSISYPRRKPKND